MERVDGTIDNVLRLPENYRQQHDIDKDAEESHDGSDIHMQDIIDVDADVDNEEEDDDIEQSLVYMICLAAPDDLLTMDTMLDQLEAEQFDRMSETAPGLRDRITDEMRSSLIIEAQEAKMSNLE